MIERTSSFKLGRNVLKHHSVLLMLVVTAGSLLAACLKPSSSPEKECSWTWINRSETGDDAESNPISGSKNWFSIASSSDGSKLAAVALGGEGKSNGSIYTSTDSGATWTHRTEAGIKKWQSIASSSDGSKLAAVLWDGSIYTSTDSGATWTHRTATGDDAESNPISGSEGWISIASSSDGSKLAAVVKDGGVYTSSDSGATWTHRTATGDDAESNPISGSKNWFSIASSSDGSKLAAVVKDGGVYTSSDYGATWTPRSETGDDAESNPISGSEGWISIASSSDGSKLAAVALDGEGKSNGSIYTSSDSGATWTHRTATGIKKWQSIASSSDGSKLAAVVWDGGIYTSDDEGVTWTDHSAAVGNKKWRSIASSSDGRRLAAVASDGGEGSDGYIYTGVFQ